MQNRKPMFGKAVVMSLEHVARQDERPDGTNSDLERIVLTGRADGVVSANVDRADVPPPPRPRKRSDCEHGPRPCPWITCRHHLYLDITDHGGVKLNYPGMSVWEIPHTCILDLVDENPDGLTLEEIGNHLGITKERVRQLVVIIGYKILWALDPDSTHEITPDRVERLLSAGVTITQVAHTHGMTVYDLLLLLNIWIVDGNPRLEETLARIRGSRASRKDGFSKRRDAIIEMLVEHPGMELRAVGEALGIPHSEMVTMANTLKKQERIYTVRECNAYRYYATRKGDVH